MQNGIRLGLAALMLIGMMTQAYADRCGSFMDDKDVQNLTTKLLHVGDVVVVYCQPCHDKAPGKPIVITSLTDRAGTKKWSTPGSRELAINGQAYDVGYLFVQSKTDPSRFDSVGAMMEYCGPHPGEASFVTVR
jgi:hypothetical protein